MDDNQLIQTMIDVHSQVSGVAQRAIQIEQAQRDLEAHLGRLEARIDAIERKLAKWSGIVISIIVAYEFFRPTIQEALIK